MVRVASLFCVILLIVYASSLPNVKPQEKKPNAVACAEGEVVTSDGKCVKAANIEQGQNATSAVQPKKKKSAKRRKLQKKLAQEMKDIKKMVLLGLEKEPLEDPAMSCPADQEFNLYGDCVPITKIVVNGTETTAKKPNKSQRIQKKLERELEIALKKEIQNELKRKRRNKKKESNKASESAASKQGGKPTQDGSRNNEELANPADNPQPT